MTYIPPPGSDHSDLSGFPPQPQTYPQTPPAQQMPPLAEAVQAPAEHLTPGLDSHGRIEPRKVSAVWVGAIIAAILLVALVIFIAQNSRTARINFLWLHGHFAIALALVLAGVIGALLVAIPGTVRIMQLRKSLKTAGRNLGTRG